MGGLGGGLASGVGKGLMMGAGKPTPSGGEGALAAMMQKSLQTPVATGAPVSGAFELTGPMGVVEGPSGPVDLASAMLSGTKPQKPMNSLMQKLLFMQILGRM